MATNNSGNWFTSPKNLVGMTLAIIAIVVHLVIGLGTFWPVIAAAAWGLGVLVTPSPRRALEAPKSKTPLVDAVTNTRTELQRLGAGPQPIQSIVRLGWVMNELEKNLDSVAVDPQLMEGVTSIAYNYLPSLVDAYDDVPVIGRPKADIELNNSLQLLIRDADLMLKAVVDNNMKGLESQREFLEEKFNDPLNRRGIEP